MSTGAFSKMRLGRMHDAMAEYVERGEVPGLVTILSRRGELQVDAIGAKSIGGRPMARDTIFRISSMTKAITAAAAMTLVEQCKLRLDEPVDRLLPELAMRRVLKRLDGPLEDTVPAVRAITVRDLLAFRMGFGIVMAPTCPIREAMEDLKLGQGPPHPAVPPAPDEWMRGLGTLPLMHQPGEKWMYHTSADVLGVLIARVAGRPLSTVLREHILEPLGMKATGFSAPQDEIDRLATSYWTDLATGALGVYDPADGGQWSRTPAFPSGGAGLVSTADDYLAFAQMLLDNGVHGTERILSRPSVELMTRDHLTPEQKAVSDLVPHFFDSHGWGFGMAVVTRGDEIARSVGSYGWDGGLGTSWWSDPTEGLTGILLTQRAWTSPSPPPVCQDFWTLAYQALDD